MGRYVVARVLAAVPTLVLAALIVFVLMRIVPGDPALLMLGELATPEDLAALRVELGLDRPLSAQLLDWLRAAATLQFGTSLVTGDPVTPLLAERFAVTAEFVLVATTLAALLAVPAGLVAAWRQDTRLDRGLVLAAVLAMSVPSFWVSLLLILTFGVQLGWLPTVGYVSVREDLGEGLQYLVLPVIALTFVQTGSLLRMMRSSAIETLRLEYVTHARAKGLSEVRVLLRHVLPNAALPVLSLLGVILGTLLAGAAVIETLFTLPGIGRLLVDSIYARDYPVVQAIVLGVAVLFVLINLGVDLLAPLLDPRVRLV